MSISNISVSNIIDIALLVVLVLTVIQYWGKGLLAGLCELLGNVFAAVGAYVFAGRVSGELFDNFLKSGMVEKVSESINQTAGAVRASEVVEAIFSFLPQNLVNTLWEKADQLIEVSQGTAGEAAAQLVDTVIAPVVVPLISIAVFFVFFILARMFISLLVATLTNINKVPIVGGANRLLGALVGFVSGGISVYLLTCVLGAIVLVTAGGIPFLGLDTLRESFFCGLFWTYNPFV